MNALTNHTTHMSDEQLPVCCWLSDRFISFKPLHLSQTRIGFDKGLKAVWGLNRHCNRNCKLTVTELSQTHQWLDCLMEVQVLHKEGSVMIGSVSERDMLLHQLRTRTLNQIKHRHPQDFTTRVVKRLFLYVRTWYTRVPTFSYNFMGPNSGAVTLTFCRGHYIKILNVRHLWCVCKLSQLLEYSVEEGETLRIQ